MSSALGDGFKHGLHITRRGGHDVEEFAYRRLSLQSFGEALLELTVLGAFALRRLLGDDSANLDLFFRLLPRPAGDTRLRTGPRLPPLRTLPHCFPLPQPALPWRRNQRQA